MGDLFAVRSKLRPNTQLRASLAHYMGQRDVRKLLIIGAMSVISASERKGRCEDPWLAHMLEKRPRMVVAVALANRMARRLWGMMTKEQNYEIQVAA